MAKIIDSSSKKIHVLIGELETFEAKNLDVYISLDGGDTLFPVDMVMKCDGKCVISYHPDFDDIRDVLRSRRSED